MSKRAVVRTRMGTGRRAWRTALVILALSIAGIAAGPPEMSHDMGGGTPVSRELGISTVRPFADLMADAMAAMDRDMRKAPMTGDPDHDFAAMMIPHHQGAIDMAKAELLYGKSPVLRRLAQEILVTQASEIVVMQGEMQKETNTGSAAH